MADTDSLSEGCGWESPALLPDEDLSDHGAGPEPGTPQPCQSDVGLGETPDHVRAADEKLESDRNRNVATHTLPWARAILDFFADARKKLGDQVIKIRCGSGCTGMWSEGLAA